MTNKYVYSIRNKKKKKCHFTNFLFIVKSRKEQYCKNIGKVAVVET